MPGSIALSPRTWWFWNTPGREGPSYHTLFTQPHVGLMLRIWANSTNLNSHKPDFTTAGTTPFEGTGVYGEIANVYVPGDQEQTEANCREAARKVAKRTIDWIRAYIGIYGYKPMSLFLQNFGRLDNNGNPYSNSITLGRFAEDALESYDPLDPDTADHYNVPFTGRARYYMRIWGDEYANFLADNLTEIEASCLVRMHFDMEQGPGPVSAIDNDDGWLTQFVDNLASANDFDRWENEIIDGTYTLKQRWEMDRPRLLDIVDDTPPGSSGPVISSPTEPFYTGVQQAHYRNSVITDWSVSLAAEVRAFTLDYCLFQPLKKRFPWIQTSEWRVHNSPLGWDQAVYTDRTDYSFPVGSVNYSTARFVRTNPLDFQCITFYPANEHPIDKYGDAMPDAFTGLGAASSGNLFDAQMAYWKETVKRLRLADPAKPIVTWVRGPNFSQAAGTYGNTVLDETNWKAQQQLLIGDAAGEQGQREMLVFDYLGASATTTDVSNLWDTAEDWLDDIKDYGVN